jgi:hypothetical protein
LYISNKQKWNSKIIGELYCRSATDGLELRTSTGKQEIEMGTEIVTIDSITTTNPAEVFRSGGLSPYLDHIRKESTAEVPDITTKKGRDRIASLAAQVSRSKTAVEKPGREYLRQIKELPKTIEAELREFVRECDSIRDSVRAPLTAWEEAEEVRITKHRDTIDLIISYRSSAFSDSTAAKNALVEVSAIPVSADLCNEFFPVYESEKTSTLAHLDAVIAQLEKQESERAELERLRAAQIESERVERERRIAEDARLAAEKAAAEREAKAKAESEARERALQEQAAKAEAARLAAEQAAKEREKKLAEESAAREKEMKEKAERDKQAAIEAEKDRAAKAEALRIAAENAIRAEDEKRARNTAHKKAVNQEILAALIANGLDDVAGKAVIVAVAKNQIPHMTINY